MKLAESGIEADVILSFIENSGTFNLGADQIVYLNDLGLSSELITAMLRHDQEIISGLRPLTTASEPDWELPFDITSTPRKQPSVKAPSLLAASPTHSSTPAATPVNQQDVEHSLPTTELAALQQSMPDALPPNTTSVFSGQPQEPGKKTSHYRVREPHPEEITPPIILFHGVGRSPNTVVVIGFPPSTP